MFELRRAKTPRYLFVQITLEVIKPMWPLYLGVTDGHGISVASPHFALRG